jgi:exodeoxyribonuclease VII large subunit
MKSKVQGGANAEIFSVSELNRAAKRLLEGEFPLIFVEGEISNFTAPGSGHWYLTLKDAGGQLRTAMFRNRNQRVRFQPRNGMKVLIRGKISLYEARGEYQFIADLMEEAGIGELRRAFEQLRDRLQAAGLFDQDKKRSLPALPQHLAIITSPTGAAIRDVLSVIKRRFPAMRSTIIPSQVQGEQAADQVVAALEPRRRFT